MLVDRRALVWRHPWHIAKDRKSTRLNSSHLVISYAVFCLKKKQATNLSGERKGCGLQIRATQCSQLSWPLRLSLSIRRQYIGTSTSPSGNGAMRPPHFSVV